MKDTYTMFGVGQFHKDLRLAWVLVALYAFFVFFMGLKGEDLRLASDGRSLEAVNVVTNTVTRETLQKAEQQTLQEIAAANAKLNDIRRYLATMDALLAMQPKQTNVTTTNVVTGNASITNFAIDPRLLNSKK